jgi:sugar fermentation stimulation protein A
MDLPQPLRAGTFVGRLNRFAAEVRLGRTVHRVHVANSGRLGELLYPGARVFTHPVTTAGRSTSHDLVLVRHGGVLVSVDSRAPSAIAAEAFLSVGVPPLSRVQAVHREAPLGRSRIDLCVRTAEGEWLVEVKGCTLVCEGTAIFPDAPTARGRRHVEALAEHVARGGRAMVLFVIQRPDAASFRPNWTTDAAFAAALATAEGAGVVVRAHTCSVSTEEIALGAAVPYDLARPESEEGPSCA